MRRTRAVLLLGLAAACARIDLPSVRSGQLVITRIFSPVPIIPDGHPGEADLAIYLTIRNDGDRADTLTGVESPLAMHPMLHGGSAAAGMEAMSALPLPAHSVTRLAPGGMHLMFEGLRDSVSAGQVIPATLTFAHAGRVAIRSRVLTYAQVDLVRADTAAK